MSHFLRRGFVQRERGGTELPPRGTDQSFTIKPVGFKDRLEVLVDYQCDCGCRTYHCGMCHCEPGYLGARCECQEGDASSIYLSACREAEGKQVCSGRGECSCNQCLCYESEFGKIYGSFCECDDFSCARHKGILCSGRTLTIAPQAESVGLVRSCRWLFFELQLWRERPHIPPRALSVMRVQADIKHAGNPFSSAARCGL
ncbi:hypothetical protein INR49_002355 [Caranx melampygus]|nr:hypothetical protein INR49_002355 [Caranx melampygus]